LDISLNGGFSPQTSILIGVFHYKPSILGYPYFWKHPDGGVNKCEKDIKSEKIMLVEDWINSTQTILIMLIQEK